MHKCHTVFQSDCHLPMKPTTVPDQMRDYFTQLDPVLTQDFLTKSRTFIGFARGIKYSLTDDIQKVLQLNLPLTLPYLTQI